MTLFPTRWMCRLVALAFAWLTLAAQAQQPAGNGSTEEQLRESLRVLLLDLVRSGAFADTPPAQLDLVIDSPPQRVVDLGLIVDSAAAVRDRDGLRVLGTTPGGIAERIGLRSGDLVVAVNGEALSGVDGAALRLRDRLAALEDGSPLRFDLRRGGQSMQVSGTFTGTWLPAARLSLGANAATTDDAAVTGTAGGCGWVTIFDTAPRQQGLHAASLNRIDGRNAGVGGQTRFRLPVGRHELEIGERIEVHYLPFNDRLRNAGGVRYKPLVVDVAADTELHVAVRLHEDRRNEWKDGAYWDPVVWRESARPCR